jgi:chemotaxis protein MotB
MSGAKDRQEGRAAPRRSSAVKAWLVAIVALGGCGALGWHTWQLMHAYAAQGEALIEAQAAADLCDGQLTPARTRASACEAARTEESARSDELVRAQKRMEEDLQATASELDSLRKLKVEAEKGAAAFEALKRDLQEMIDTKQLEVKQRDGRLVVQLPAEVLFASGSADLSEDGKVALIKLSAALERMPDRRFMVAGHTDALAPAKGSKFRDNWELSTARAVTVTELLVTAKIDPRNLVAAGYGEFAPIGDNRSESGRKLNRRIEIVLLPKLEQLPVVAEAAPASASKSP